MVEITIKSFEKNLAAFYDRTENFWVGMNRKTSAANSVARKAHLLNENRKYLRDVPLFESFVYYDLMKRRHASADTWDLPAWLVNKECAKLESRVHEKPKCCLKIKDTSSIYRDAVNFKPPRETPEQYKWLKLYDPQIYDDNELPWLNETTEEGFLKLLNSYYHICQIVVAPGLVINSVEISIDKSSKYYNLMVVKCVYSFEIATHCIEIAEKLPVDNFLVASYQMYNNMIEIAIKKIFEHHIFGFLVFEKDAEKKSKQKQDDNNDDDDDQMCAICFDSDNLIRTKKCGHYFCEECLQKWLAIKGFCPYCKSQLLNDNSAQIDDIFVIWKYQGLIMSKYWKLAHMCTNSGLSRVMQKLDSAFEYESRRSLSLNRRYKVILSTLGLCVNISPTYTNFNDLKYSGQQTLKHLLANFQNCFTLGFRDVRKSEFDEYDCFDLFLGDFLLSKALRSSEFKQIHSLTDVSIMPAEIVKESCDAVANSLESVLKNRVHSLSRTLMAYAGSHTYEQVSQSDRSNSVEPSLKDINLFEEYYNEWCSATSYKCINRDAVTFFRIKFCLPFVLGCENVIINYQDDIDTILPKVRDNPTYCKAVMSAYYNGILSSSRLMYAECRKTHEQFVKRWQHQLNALAILPDKLVEMPHVQLEMCILGMLLTLGDLFLGLQNVLLNGDVFRSVRNFNIEFGNTFTVPVYQLILNGCQVQFTTDPKLLNGILLRKSLRIMLADHVLHFLWGPLFLVCFLFWVG